MELHAYTYVGPEEIRRSVAAFPVGTPITSTEEAEAWLQSHPEGFTEGATYVVDLQGRLRLAPRRSEHVACAGGEEVLAAGELRFRQAGPRLAVAEVSNQSTGYCPDTPCWAAVARALEGAGLSAPPGFTREIVFRRCPRCTEAFARDCPWSTFGRLLRRSHRLGYSAVDRRRHVAALYALWCHRHPEHDRHEARQRLDDVERRIRRIRRDLLLRTVLLEQLAMLRVETGFSAVDGPAGVRRVRPGR